MITKAAGTPMTEPQFSYLISLIGQAYATDPTARIAALVEAAGYDFNAASTKIDFYKPVAKNAPAAAVAMPAYLPPFGHYLVDGSEIHVKKPNYGTGAMVIKDGKFLGMVGKHAAATAALVQLDSAETAYACVVAFAKATSKCGVCHTKLKDPKSIAAGIGPVCAKKYGK